MLVQSSNPTTMGYFKTLKSVESKEKYLSKILFNEDEKKNNNPRFEVRNEGGYIRKYIVKADGDKILISETKQTKEGMQSNETGDLIDIAHDMLMKQLDQSSNPILQEKQSMATWEKENGIARYKTGI